MMNEMPRVDLDDLDYDYDDYLTLYEGKPFTGQSIEEDSDGNIVDISTYKRGVEHGMQKSWYPNGQIKVTGFVKNGIAHDVWKTWHPNGQLYEVTEFDDAGNRMYIRKWSAEGELLRDEVFHERLRPLIDPEANF